MKLRRLISLVLVWTLVLWALLPAFSFADGELPAEYDQAVTVLSYFHLVSGDAGGYRPLDTLTRAEVAKLAVAGMAMADQAAYYQNSSYFPDASGHWAKGYIGLARQLGIMTGYPDGTFRPDAPVSYAEVVALMGRVGGLGPSGSDWPMGWVRSAQDAGVIPPGASYLTSLASPAQRADVFVMLYRALTQIKDFSGMSLLQRRFKPSPPAIVLDTLPVSTKDVSLVVSGTVDGALSVTVNGTAATLQGNHFSAQVPLVLGSNTIAVSATDIAGNTNLAQQQIVRENTDPAKITIVGSHTFPAGKNGHLDIVITDTNGAPIYNLFNLTVNVPSALGSFDPYSGTLYTAQTPAQGTISFTLGNATATWDVTIGAGSEVSYKILPENPLVKRGQEVQFSLSGVDQYGNTVDVTGIPVTWQSDSGGVINAQGRFAAATNGKAKVTAVVGNQSVSTQVTVYGPAAKIGVIVQGNLTANNVDTLKAEVQAQDADGNLVPDYNGTFYASSSSPNSFNPTASSIQIVNGTGTVEVKAGTLPGSANLIVTSNDLASIQAPINVSAQTLAAIALSVQNTSINADGVTKQNLAVTAVDSGGKPLLTPLNPPLIVHLVSSSASQMVFDSTQGNTVDVGLGAMDSASGTVTSNVVIRSGTTEGTGTIAGIVTSPKELGAIQVRTLQLKIVHVGSASKLSFDTVKGTTAGSTVPLYLRVLDANGNQVTNASALQSIILTLTDQNGTVYPATVGLVQGSGRAEFDLVLYKSTTFTFNATATVSGGSGVILPASQSVVVSSGVPVGLSVSALPSLLRLDGGVSHTTITATVQDAYGNVVPSGSYNVHFQRTQGNGATGDFKDSTVPTSQGIAQVVVPSGGHIATDTFTATADGLTTRNTVDVSGVIMGIPSKLALRYGDNNGDGIVNGPGDNNGTVGTPVTVYVDILDNNTPGYVATMLNGQIITLSIKNLTTGDQKVYTSPVQYGTAAFTFTLSQATTYSLQATTAALTPAGTIGFGGTTPDLVLHSGAGAALVVTSDLQTIKAAGVPGSSYASVSVSLTDAVGNPTINTSPAPIVVTLKGSNTTYGYFTQDGTPTGTKTDTATLSILPNQASSNAVSWYAAAQSGPVTLAASANGFATGTSVVTTKIVGPVAKMYIQPIANTVEQPFATDDSSVAGQDIKISVEDEQGTLVNDYGTNGEKISLTTMDPGSVIVAYYNYATGLWSSLDQVPGNGVGDYPTTYAVPAYKGQAWFRTRANTTGTFHYVVANAASPQQATVTLTQTGTFVAGALTRLSLVATPTYRVNGTTINPVAGGGKTITVTAQFVDQYGNVLANQSGTVYFQSQAGQMGSLLSTNAIAQNGVASAVFQSTSTGPLPTGTFQITAYTPVTQPGGAPLTNGSQANPATITITEDSIAPTVQTVAIAPGGTADQKVTPGDYFTVNFSKTVNAGGIFSSLTPGTTLATGLSNLRVFFNQGTNSDTITFGGGLTLGTITLQGDSMSGLNGQSSVAYGVSSLSMSADGTQVTVVLGSPQGTASPIGLTLSSDPTKSTFAPSTSLTDLAGNAMVGTPVNLNANSGF